jgi:hypothetical protein
LAAAWGRAGRFRLPKSPSGWRPVEGEFGAQRDREFSVADLLRFAQVTIA